MSITRELFDQLTDLLPVGSTIDGGLYGLTPKRDAPLVLIAQDGFEPAPVITGELFSVAIIIATAQQVGIDAEDELETWAGTVRDALDALPWALRGKADRITYKPDPDQPAGFPGYSIPITVITQPAEDPT